MKEYDAIVIGSGCGIIIVNEALAHGLKVALVDRGPVGGTCLNLGCLPSKMLIVPADRILQVQESSRLGVRARIEEIDFKSIMERMRNAVAESREGVRGSLLKNRALDFYEGTGTFVGEHTLEVKGETIRGKKVFIASGARPLIPPIEGLDSIDYLTNETLLQLTGRPESLLIIGGGYIAVEYGHFFAAMGTRVTIIEMADKLLPSEEPEISELLMNEMGQRVEIHTSTLALKCRKNSQSFVVHTKNQATGRGKEFSAEKLLIAVGRSPNSDLLALEKTGVQTDSKGFILVDEYLETTRKNIYAVGDANGKQMFTHTANREARLVASNVMHDQWVKMDFSASPHAVFSHPQVASVGLTEAKAKENHQILVGMARYYSRTMGMAMMEKSGFAKAIVEKGSEKILGFHIIGPEASILIQEVVNAMAKEGTIQDIRSGLHIHPALPEVVAAAFANLAEPR